MHRPKATIALLLTLIFLCSNALISSVLASLASLASLAPPSNDEQESPVNDEQESPDQGRQGRQGRQGSHERHEPEKNDWNHGHHGHHGNDEPHRRLWQLWDKLTFFLDPKSIAEKEHRQQEDEFLVVNAANAVNGADHVNFLANLDNLATARDSNSGDSGANGANDALVLPSHHNPNNPNNANNANSDTIRKPYAQIDLQHHPGFSNAYGVMLHPSKVYISIHNPDPDHRYSVTIVSPDRYTGTATLLEITSEVSPIWVHEWIPPFPGTYHIIIHALLPIKLSRKSIVVEELGPLIVIPAEPAEDHWDGMEQMEQLEQLEQMEQMDNMESVDQEGQRKKREEREQQMMDHILNTILETPSCTSLPSVGPRMDHLSAQMGLDHLSNEAVESRLGTLGMPGMPGMLGSLNQLDRMNTNINNINNMDAMDAMNAMNLYSQWDGDWIGPELTGWTNDGLTNKWVGDEFYFGERLDVLRTGWTFVPRFQLHRNQEFAGAVDANGQLNQPGPMCHFETFTQSDLLSLPRPKSVVVLGTSRERGVFLSLVDMLLNRKEKEHLEESVVGKCWGRAQVTKGNLQITYQDFRANFFEPPTDTPHVTCHNDKVVKEATSSMVTNAVLTWRELFDPKKKQSHDENPTQFPKWPDVVYLLCNFGDDKFYFESHLLNFIQSLPPPELWSGTILIGDYNFSARSAGIKLKSDWIAYQNGVLEMMQIINDPRVRWLDGIGISKEMRMYAELGENGVGVSQHFHRFCNEDRFAFQMQKKNRYRLRSVPDREGMAVCSNVTEMLGQLILSHAIGPKKEFLKEKLPVQDWSARLTVCHNCPLEMIPFHITPNPDLTCMTGQPLHVRTSDEVADADGSTAPGTSEGTGSCPDWCLRQERTDLLSTQSDVVEVRECPVVDSL